MTEQDTAQKILSAGGLLIRDIAGGEEPFSYTSGNRGPGYCNIKNLVGQQFILREIVSYLLSKITSSFDAIAANDSGGTIFGWELCSQREHSDDKLYGFVRVNLSQKKHGLLEQIIGAVDNPLIKEGTRFLLVDDVVNFATTMVESAELLRSRKYVVANACAVVDYENPVGHQRLRDAGITLTSAITLRSLLSVAEEKKKFPKDLIDDYRAFLDDPKFWQLSQGIIPPIKPD